MTHRAISPFCSAMTTSSPLVMFLFFARISLISESVVLSLLSGAVLSQSVLFSALRYFLGVIRLITCLLVIRISPRLMKRAPIC
jgi:hypothetical protein